MNLVRRGIRQTYRQLGGLFDIAEAAEHQQRQTIDRDVAITVKRGEKGMNGAEVPRGYFQRCTGERCLVRS
ncbi:hypothetical protein AA103196_2398 [Ameyamaea chiangmaiensis NBRC 103196]|nr:hypothetical protein AA103196_2398 [Ameyamaea chiangmaiensis NBRC 103196]